MQLLGFTEPSVHSLFQANMVQRDIIQEQIEQLGRVLGKILADFLKLRTNADPVQAISITQEELREQVGFDFPHFTTLDGAAALAYVTQLELTGEHLDHLAKFAVQVAEAQPLGRKENLRSALRLLDLAALRSETVTFDRIFLRRRIEEGLEGE
ncbi:hypothetical protein [Lewinella sp. 4G2]|uniref:hypothetical protein n=1 Tax=Lewinella sp. 4G2 TaxID=1803372 RepID=UPI0007B49EE5|nr:hypothetical protein [Lewinella sp. 4G2]OAV44038.1 hypothetical protein A3850_005800 [Lewinella sp. 4G2]